MPHHFEHIQIRRGKCTDFISTNPILKDGEPSYVLDDNGFPVIKIGDGKTPWVDLPTFLFQTQCTPPTTTEPPEPPKIDPANCNELLCVAMIDESDGRQEIEPIQLVAMLRAFPGRIFVMCPVVPVCPGGDPMKNFLPAYDAHCRSLDDFPDNEGATKFVWCLYNDLGVEDTVVRDESRYCNHYIDRVPVPWTNGTEQLAASQAYKDSGGIWARIKKIFVGNGALAHPDIKQRFSELRVIAAWGDLTGSTGPTAFTAHRDQLISAALRDKGVTNPVEEDKGLVRVGIVDNGAESAICPFTEPDCCKSPNSDPALVSALNDLCAAYNGGAFDCTTTTTTTTTKSPEITTSTTTTTTSTTTTTTSTTTSTTTTTTGGPCLGADYYINIHKSPIQWEAQSACPTSYYRPGFESFYSTIVWDQDSEKYYATKYYAGGYRLVFIITCDSTKNGHAKWSAESWTDCPNGYSAVSAVITEGTDTDPPVYELEMDVGDCECIPWGDNCSYNLRGTSSFGGGYWDAQDSAGEDAGTNSNEYCDKKNPFVVDYIDCECQLPSTDPSTLPEGTIEDSDCSGADTNCDPCDQTQQAGCAWIVQGGQWVISDDSNCIYTDNIADRSGGDAACSYHVAVRDYIGDETKSLVCPSGYSVYANTGGFATEFPSGICLPDGTAPLDRLSTQWPNLYDCECPDPAEQTFGDDDVDFHNRYPPGSGAITILRIPCPDCIGYFPDGEPHYKIYGTPKGHNETNVRGDRLP